MGFMMGQYKVCESYAHFLSEAMCYAGTQAHVEVPSRTPSFLSLVAAESDGASLQGGLISLLFPPLERSTLLTGLLFMK